MKTMLLVDNTYHAVVSSYTITTDGTMFRKPNGLTARTRRLRRSGKMLWDIQTSNYDAGYARIGSLIVVPVVTREHWEAEGRLTDGIFHIYRVEDTF
jgi:hypothetical protein